MTRPAAVLLACAVMCAALAMGLRQSFGLFLAPMTAAHAWSASGFSLAIVLQVLLNGLAQPLCGQAPTTSRGRSPSPPPPSPPWCTFRCATA